MKPRTFESFVFVGAILAPTLAAPSLVAQRATISGQVVVTHSTTALSYAVVGATPGASERFTGSDGQFLLRDVPPGRITISARHIGYTSLDTTINVVAGDSVNIRLELAPINIQRPVVRALS